MNQKKSHFPQLYQEGWLEEQLKTKSIRKIAEEVGCTFQAVSLATIKLGIPHRGVGEVLDPDARRICPILYRDGWLEEQLKTKSIRKIALDQKCKIGVVYGAMRRQKLNSEVKDLRSPFTQFYVPGWLKDQLAIKSVSQIAIEFGCANISVYRAIKKLGIDKSLVKDGRRKEVVLESTATA